MQYIDKRLSLPAVDGNEGREYVVEVEKVKGPRVQSFEGTNGTIELTEGNYVVTHPDGRIEGVAAEDFAKNFTKAKTAKKK